MSSQPVSVSAIAASELRHHLRTPLNHIIGYSEILLEEYPAGLHRGPLEGVLAEANEMVDLVQVAATGEQLNVSALAFAQLRDKLHPRITAVERLTAEARQTLPAPAREELDRIASSAHNLGRILVDGKLASLVSQPHPMETPAEPRQISFSGPGRILVVDDDEMNRDMLCRQLERQRHSVETACDGPEAFGKLRDQRYDVVLLDLMMPGMNGFEVLERIKRDPAFTGVSVIMVSALDEMESVVRSIEAGAEDYLFKPVNPTLLRARIKSTLEKMRAEESLHRKQRLESIGLLAAGIAHDFNNLLTGIIGHAQLLEHALTQREDLDMAEAIVSAGERAAELTQQLLAYSGKAMFQMKPVDLASTIRGTESLVQASLPGRVRLHLKPAPVPAVLADESQIEQVLVNIVQNAAEAIGTETAGSITIETGTEKVTPNAQFNVMPDEMPGGWFAWFEVRDTGCGMDAGTTARMFEPFFSTKFLGRGLGLAAVSGIVRAHRGLLRVTSTPRQGTAVRVCLPAIASPELRIEAPAASGPMVLVVDDEPVVRQIVKVALERAGRRVMLAESGEAAVEAFESHKADVQLVLLDWKMPMMDGAQTLRRLRAIRPEVKVIVSSGIPQGEAEERFRDMRVTGYLQKPYRMSDLIALAEQAVQNPS